MIYYTIPYSTEIMPGPTRSPAPPGRAAGWRDGSETKGDQ